MTKANWAGRWKQCNANTGVLCWPEQQERSACHEHSLQGEAAPIREQKRTKTRGLGKLATADKLDYLLNVGEFIKLGIPPILISRM